ncbi:MAG: hypothetical protein JWO68_54 [Actinomycetia bacterium]|nr:hypothetical protein [Actinomycetes bacterium]
MGGRRRSGLLAVAVALALTGSVSAMAAADERPTLVEAPACAAPTPLAAVDGSRSDGATVVSFQVPALTRLRVEGGRVVGAATNTGCAPRPSDRFVVGDRLATPDEAAAAVTAFRSGDWTTPGAWH